MNGRLIFEIRQMRTCMAKAIGFSFTMRMCVGKIYSHLIRVFFPRPPVPSARSFFQSEKDAFQLMGIDLDQMNFVQVLREKGGNGVQVRRKNWQLNSYAI